LRGEAKTNPTAVVCYQYFIYGKKVVKFGRPPFSAQSSKFTVNLS